MRRYILLIAMLLACLGALSSTNIIVMPGTGRTDADDAKQYHYHYHSFSDDFHLSGPTTWAVRFNFGEPFTAADSASFNLQAIRMYSPIASASYKLSLKSEAVSPAPDNELLGYPGALISPNAEVTVNYNAPQMDVAFPGIPDSLKVVWLIIEILQPVGSYLSASDGGGEYSYYEDGSGTATASWHNLQESGFACELRFGALGTYNLENPRLELSDFSLGASLMPDTTTYPVFTVFNHGAESVNGAQMQLAIKDPSLEYTRNITIPISTIPPHDSLIVTSAQAVDFPRDPTQLEVIATLSSGGVTSTSVRYFNIFGETYNCHLVENFRRYSNVSLNIPQAINNAQNLVYFPNQSDQFSNLPALQRFNTFSFNSLPKTVIDGSIKFHLPTDSTAVLQAMEMAVDTRTFVSGSICTVVPDSVNAENLHLDLAISNDSTKLFEWSATSPINPGLYIGLFEPISISGTTYYNIIRWLSYGEQLSGTMTVGTTLEKSLLINVANLPLQNGYRIYYWLQNDTSNNGTIFYANYTTLPYTSNSEDNYIPIPVVRAFPNPSRGEVKLTGLSKGTILAVYNLKGQKVFSSTSIEKELSLPQSIFPGSGIYFIRTESPSGSNNKQTTKISIIK